MVLVQGFSDEIVIGALITFGAVIMYWISATIGITPFLRKIGLISESDDKTVEQHEVSDIIPSTLFLGGKAYTFLGAETVKEGDENGETIYRIRYGTPNGDKFKDIPESRLEIPVTPAVIKGEEIIFNYIGDSELDKKDILIKSLKDKIDKMKGQIASMNEQISESKFPESYRKSRIKQREGAVYSSRTFSGSGTRYEHEMDENNLNDEDLE